MNFDSSNSRFLPGVSREWVGWGVRAKMELLFCYSPDAVLRMSTINSLTALRFGSPMVVFSVAGVLAKYTTAA